MGIPKFFPYLKSRYPGIIVDINENEIPEFDCLYLDMNGIFHRCTHSNNFFNYKLTESEMFDAMFGYIDHLFNIIKPKELFYLAVDGVAPRAKMNQQRSRRYKSSLDRQEYVTENNVTTEVFNPNVITPGTDFMERLDVALNEFIKFKMETDPLWQGVDVIFSGHRTPGEGEHKIQEYIRYRKTLPDYDPFKKHCLYGLDTDLIILGLATHEPYFTLLREKYGPHLQTEIVDEPAPPVEVEFCLIYVSLLREFIELEFRVLKQSLGQEFDLDRLIDDWILMSFFVGNDFVPHLPHFHIHRRSIPILWLNYIKSRPKMKGYMLENGVINVENLMLYFQQLDVMHMQVFDREYRLIKKNSEIYNLESDSGFLNKGIHLGKTRIDRSWKYKSITMDCSLLWRPIRPFDYRVPVNNDSLYQLNSLDGHDVNMSRSYFESNKQFYYSNKFGLINDPNFIENMCFDYLQALQWISFYYLCGVQSWDYFYPYHYAPYFVDLLRIPKHRYADVSVMNMSQPFLPYEQLMAVLPPESSDLIPAPFRPLMLDPTSPIIHFYPHSFDIDMNSKQFEWEAIALIPFIDESQLLAAINPCKHNLSAREQSLNTNRPFVQYTNSSNLDHSNFTDIHPDSRVYYRFLDIDSHRLSLDDVVHDYSIMNRQNDMKQPNDFPLLSSEKYLRDFMKISINTLDRKEKSKTFNYSMREYPQPILLNINRFSIHCSIPTKWFTPLVSAKPQLLSTKQCYKPNIRVTRQIYNYFSQLIKRIL